jgi:hypothetical protein
MNFRRRSALVVALLGSLLGAVFVLTAGCELVVRLDLGLVDAGSNDACALCFDGMLVTGPDGALEVVPFEAGEDAGRDADSGPEQ